MNTKNVEALTRVVNTLMLIDTHGENSFAMVQCIQTLRSIIDSEKARAKAEAVAPAE